MAKSLARLTGLLLLAAVLAALSPLSAESDSVRWDKVDPRLRLSMQANAQSSWPIIVEAAVENGSQGPALANPDRSSKAVARVRATRGRAIGLLPLIGAATATGDFASIAQLSRDPGVAYISYDAPLFALDAAPTSNVYEQAIHAPEVWHLGYQGQGVGVAILDSGVNPNRDLVEPVNRLLARVDLAGDQPGMADPAGHGTHVAGIIAGNGHAAPADETLRYAGVAPKANLVDVRVMDRDGRSTVSTVIRGVHWVIGHRQHYNIRVLNLSAGYPVSAGYSYKQDPLAAALEIAWRAGITVVVAAGNGGPDAGSIHAPAADPMLLAVGALDDQNTVPTGDDVVASFSARGPTLDGLGKPDLVASGRRIVSLRSPGSHLDTLLSDRIVTSANGSSYFRLSGTSMAAPVVAGVAALLIEKNPALSPDGVKYILTRSARPVAGHDANAVGSGAVDAYAAVTGDLVGRANRGVRPSDGLARFALPYLKGRALGWRDAHFAGRDWNGVDWKNIFWDGVTWDNIFWDNIFWDNVFWDNIFWDNIFWDTVDSANIDASGVGWDAGVGAAAATSAID